MTTPPPYGTPPPRASSPLSRSFLPLALITLGVFFLLGNLVPDRGRGGLIVLGLGVAFLIGRLTTGRYGYAVPGGILVAIGAYLLVQDIEGVRGAGSGGLFFVLLGLGFALVYAVGMRPVAIWPLFPAAILVGLGLILLGVASLGPLASLSWIASFWPVALVLLGLWLLLRESLPPAVRGPLAAVGGLALLGYGILAAAASVAAGGSLARTGVAPSFGTAPFADTITLNAPIAAGQTFTVTNSSGPTTVHGGAGPDVRVTAVRHFAVGGQGPDVQLTPTSAGVTLQASTSGRAAFPFGDASWVEYTVEVPSGVAVTAQSSSGRLQIDGVSGAVQATTSSGGLDLSNLSGSVQAQSSSGAINLTNVAGDVRVSSSSGSIHGTQLLHVRQAQTTSGSISLEGVFTDAAQISASSGSVNLKLLPGTAVQLDVHTGSGSVQPQGGLALAGGVTRRDTLTGAIGTPAPGATLTVQTSSGSVTVSQ